jgi:hypothetical protein
VVQLICLSEREGLMKPAYGSPSVVERPAITDGLIEVGQALRGKSGRLYFENIKIHLPRRLNNDEKTEKILPE